MSAGFLPFSAVVGQDEAKLALLLAAVDRRIGGVLLRGDKGSAKSTLARGLAALLPGGAPFVELPVGATEDRVVGTLDLAAALTGGHRRFEPGLLHAAHGGVLYVDEINLLPDHLVDVLLDVAASGVNRVEREGVSHSHPSRFVLIGSMNPEEGDLRPQLLDRFGLAVDVRTPSDPVERASALRRRLEFDAGGPAVERFAAADAELGTRLAAAVPAGLDDELVGSVAAICGSVGAEGLRADITICRAAAALAGWEGRAEATGADVRRVAPLALAHRARRDPLDPVFYSAQDLSEALDRELGDAPAPAGPDEEEGLPGQAESDTGAGRDDGADGVGAPELDRQPGGGAPETVAPETVAPPGEAAAPVVGAAARRLDAPASGRRSPAPGPRGRLIGDRPADGPVTSVAVGATVRHAAARRAGSGPGAATVEVSDVRQAVRQQRTANLIVVAVDASGSMGAAQRMETAKGAVLSLLRDAYQRRDLVSLVTFRGDDATVVLRPTASMEVARARLTDLPTGGRTPLAAGLQAALAVATAPARAGSHLPLLVVITDGRATAAPPGQDPLAATQAVAERIRRSGVPAVVVDVEGAGATRPGPRLGLAADLAARMGADHVPVGELSAAAVEDAVRRSVPGSGRPASAG